MQIGVHTEVWLKPTKVFPYKPDDYKPMFKCSLLSGVSEKQLTRPSMSVCLSVVFFLETWQPPDQGSLHHYNNRNTSVPTMRTHFV